MRIYMYITLIAYSINFGARISPLLFQLSVVLQRLSHMLLGTVKQAYRLRPSLHNNIRLSQMEAAESFESKRASGFFLLSHQIIFKTRDITKLHDMLRQGDK